MSTVFTQSSMFEKEFDSKNEAMFSLYLSELKNAGYIKEITYQPEAFVLTDDLTVFVYEQHKDDNEIKNVKMLRGASYTADFKVEWTCRAKDLFYWLEGRVYPKGFFPYRKAKANVHIPFFARLDKDAKPISWIDVKGAFSGAHGLAKFSVVQKWLESKGTFIQKIVVTLDEKSIFVKTFTPRLVIAQEIYKKNCKHGKEGDSKLKYEPILLEHYLKWKK